MKYPTVQLGGKTYDIYDIAEALEITSPPLFNAFKKIIRRGNGAKTERQDLEEAKQSLDRYLRSLPRLSMGRAVRDALHKETASAQTAGLTPVLWGCPACGHPHIWHWPEYEILDGQCKMICDHCGTETIMEGDGLGNYLPRP